MSNRNLFAEARVTSFAGAAGLFVNTQMGGTVNGAPLGEYEYHSVQFVGSFGHQGTLNVYACTNAGGSNPVLVKSLSVGSGDNPAAAIDVKSSALGSLGAALGTPYTHLGAMGSVGAGGTWRGALMILSTNGRVEPPGTTGLQGYGSFLSGQ